MSRSVRSGILVGLAFAVLGFVLPGWMVFLLSVALAKGLAVLGVTLLMRGGLVSFGQGLMFAGGAYAAGFAIKYLGLREALLLLASGAATGLVLAALTGFLVARYREIFFGMLTMAFSMAFYGVLVKAFKFTGGTDGLRIPPPTILGYSFPAQALPVAAYFLTLACVALVGYLSHLYLNAPLGYLMRAIRDNEVRVEYLGASVARAIFVTNLLAGGAAGLGGGLLALTVGHIDPQLAYWTTSGEFVFVALLGGSGNVFAPLGGSLFVEFVRSYANKYAPYTWQMVLGGIMLLIVLLLPGGISTLVTRRARGAKA